MTLNWDMVCCQCDEKNSTPLLCGCNKLRETGWTNCYTFCKCKWWVRDYRFFKQDVSVARSDTVLRNTG
jgi:hypothetical protein